LESWKRCKPDAAGPQNATRNKRVADPDGEPVIFWSSTYSDIPMQMCGHTCARDAARRFIRIHDILERSRQVGARKELAEETHNDRVLLDSYVFLSCIHLHRLGESVKV
jgi:hypothetical protein